MYSQIKMLMLLARICKMIFLSLQYASFPKDSLLVQGEDISHCGWNERKAKKTLKINIPEISQRNGKLVKILVQKLLV